MEATEPESAHEATSESSAPEANTDPETSASAMEDATAEQEASASAMEDATVEQEASAPSVSKRQLKRIRKGEMMKIAHKEKKDRKKEAKRQKREAEPEVEKPIKPEKDHATLFQSRQDRKEEANKTYLENCSKNFAVILDCAWEGCHTEGDLKSLNQQVMHCYGKNRKHTNPAFVHITGLGKRRIGKACAIPTLYGTFAPTSVHTHHTPCHQGQSRRFISPS